MLSHNIILSVAWDGVGQRGKQKTSFMEFQRVSRGFLGGFRAVSMGLNEVTGRDVSWSFSGKFQGVSRQFQDV